MDVKPAWVEFDHFADASKMVGSCVTGYGLSSCAFYA